MVSAVFSSALLPDNIRFFNSNKYLSMVLFLSIVVYFVVFAFFVLALLYVVAVAVDDDLDFLVKADYAFIASLLFLESVL